MIKNSSLEFFLFFSLLSITIIIFGCNEISGSKVRGQSHQEIITDKDYIVFAWNDVGMHCLNPTYDELVILPPYNNLFVQVVKKGAPPQMVTSGITVEYRIINNTYSYGKTAAAPIPPLTAIISPVTNLWRTLPNLFFPVQEYHGKRNPSASPVMR